MSLYIVCLVSGDQLRSPAVSRTLNLDNMLSIIFSGVPLAEIYSHQELVAYSLINDDLQISEKKTSFLPKNLRKIINFATYW